MLSLHIIAVGKDKDTWVTEQLAHYRKLLQRYARTELSLVPDEKYTKAGDIKKLKAKEAERILARLKGGYFVALDDSGKEFDTREFARELGRLQTTGHSLIEFVIGGAYGLDEALKKKADLVLSLSRLTLSHQIARLVLMEQLYRALDINAGGSYHK